MTLAVARKVLLRDEVECTVAELARVLGRRAEDDAWVDAPVEQAVGVGLVGDARGKLGDHRVQEAHAEAAAPAEQVADLRLERAKALLDALLAIGLPRAHEVLAFLRQRLRLVFVDEVHRFAGEIGEVLDHRQEVAAGLVEQEAKLRRSEPRQLLLRHLAERFVACWLQLQRLDPRLADEGRQRVCLVLAAEFAPFALPMRHYDEHRPALGRRLAPQAL